MVKKLAALFSGGKDSCLATFLAKKNKYEIVCLISVFSENEESYMFHTPSISQVKKQAEVMDVPLLIEKTKGEKEKELRDLENVIKKAKDKFEIGGVVTGAVASDYQASRIQKICDKLKIECFNPLWGKDQFELLQDLIKNKFEVIVIHVAAEGFDESWLGRKIDLDFINDVRELYEKNRINPAAEGGEFESYVLNCPLFKRGLKVVKKRITGKGYSYRMEIEVSRWASKIIKLK